MQEYELNVLEQYNIDVTGTHKTRGAILCDTQQGLFLLREVAASEKRIPALCELYNYLKSQGYDWMDQIIPNREGEYVSTAEDGGKYMLKQWYQGRECDIRKPAELLSAAGNLAKLHTVMRHKLEQGAPTGTHLKEEYIRHNRELKKVRRFMRGISPKGEFEFAFLKYFDQMYQWADIALDELEHSEYDALYQESIEKCCMTHGEYNYHNILILSGNAVPGNIVPGNAAPGSLPEAGANLNRRGASRGTEYRGHGSRQNREPIRIATTNFEKFKKDIQVEDLYYFLRKVMEKHGWKERLGDNMLNAYSAVRPLSTRETEYIKNRLIYPEKFWKIADSYYHSNKAWISVKSIEKLNVAIRQTEEKKRFLENIFSFHLQDPVV